MSDEEVRVMCNRKGGMSEAEILAALVQYLSLNNRSVRSELYTREIVPEVGGGIGCMRQSRWIPVMRCEGQEAFRL
jgi:hypothetical protein